MNIKNDESPEVAKMERSISDTYSSDSEDFSMANFKINMKRRPSKQVRLT